MESNQGESAINRKRERERDRERGGCGWEWMESVEQVEWVERVEEAEICQPQGDESSHGI